MVVPSNGVSVAPKILSPCSCARSIICFKPAMMSSALTVSDSRRRGARVSQVVDPFEHDHVLHARLRQNIAIEPRQRVHAKPDIASDRSSTRLPPIPGVQHSNRLAAAPRAQTLRQNVGPAMIGVDGRPRAVGDRVAERHQGGGSLGGQHIHAGEKNPRGDGRGFRKLRRAREVARPDVVGLLRP